MNKRRAYEQAGRKAEKRVATYLKHRGYKILAERFKTAYGEIDLIAQKNKTIAFVEVKQRATQSAIDKAMDYRTEQRVITAAEIWVEQHFDSLPADFEIRYDFASITGPVHFLSPVKYIKNAFYTY